MSSKSDLKELVTKTRIIPFTEFSKAPSSKHIFSINSEFIRNLFISDQPAFDESAQGLITSFAARPFNVLSAKLFYSVRDKFIALSANGYLSTYLSQLVQIHHLLDNTTTLKPLKKAQEIIKSLKTELDKASDITMEIKKSITSLLNVYVEVVNRFLENSKLFENWQENLKTNALSSSEIIESESPTTQLTAYFRS